ncbi:MAG TPA: STAS/SEC14 domain-containing protein [Egibacteraceae bacterium]|nr:STAS/SEC14 domain-containing protein [Egibacteraceae bacterium]
MMRPLENSHDNVIGYSLAGEVAENEYRQLVSELRDAIARHGRIRLLFRVSDIAISSFFSALDERFEFVKEHGDDIERVAVVSDDKATEWLSRLSGAVQSIDTRHFPREEETAAWAWLE